MDVLNPFVPSGVVVAYAGSAAPAGWLLCDGSQISRATYNSLFAAIGTAHGTGDGATTFHLPDYRGRFLRGVDGAAGRDPNDSTRTAMNTGGNTGDNVGSVQTDAFQGHYHDMYYDYASNSPAAGPYYFIGANGNNTSNGPNDAIRSPLTDGSNGTPRTSSETRPINAYVNYIIKV